jgi:hypothetical protein
MSVSVVSDVSRFTSCSCVRRLVRSLPLCQTRLVTENRLSVLTGLRPMELQTLEPRASDASVALLLTIEILIQQDTWHHLEHRTLVTASVAMATDASGDPVVGIMTLFEGVRL